MVEVVEPKEGEVFDVELEENLLAKNRKIAKENMEIFRTYSIKTFDVMGSVGSGKTTLLENLIEELKDSYRIAVIEGDVATTIDSDLIARHGVPVVQINTGKECHLDANLVKQALAKLNIKQLDILFIENVGNLICPAEFPLGCDKRIVVISVTEGPYMVMKHPMIFMGADLVIINKMDLAKAMTVDVSKLRNDLFKINPKVPVIHASFKIGLGVKEVVQVLGLN